MKVGVIMDPIQSINLKKDSTLMIMLEMQSRGHEIHYIDPNSLAIKQGASISYSHKLSINLKAEDKFLLSDFKEINLNSFQVIFMRQDPPFDMDYIYNTYILDMAEQEGVLIVNRPSSLRNCNEKVFTTQFPQCCTPYLIASEERLLKDFIYSYKDIVAKPLDGMGGSSIYKIRHDDLNVSVILEDLTKNFKRKIMLQVFIPEITDGDKRIILINGRPMNSAIARIPSEGEFRGNLASGGVAIAKSLTDRDKWICDEIGPILKDLGLIFVGIDIIGDYLTEINVTSPTCIQEYKNLCDIDVTKVLVDYVENNL